mgnify:CR=1 FL=1
MPRTSFHIIILLPAILLLLLLPKDNIAGKAPHHSAERTSDAPRPVFPEHTDLVNHCDLPHEDFPEPSFSLNLVAYHTISKEKTRFCTTFMKAPRGSCWHPPKNIKSRSFRIWRNSGCQILITFIYPSFIYISMGFDEFLKHKEYAHHRHYEPIRQ